MQPAEFEEKEYEMPLYYELLCNSQSNLWTPGQVFEQHFGIDAALDVNNPLFWNIVGYSAPPRGVVLDDYKWSEIWRIIKKFNSSAKPIRRPLPNFQVNLLLQVKRPDYLKGTNSSLSGLGISSSYWRFKITEHQQNALEYIERKLSHRALVAYGCAAFHTLSELYSHIAANTLTTNSSFVRPARLAGHREWVYDQPGMVGVACSEKKRIEEPSLFSQVEKLIIGVEKIDATQKEQEERTIKGLHELDHMLIEAMKELSKTENPVALEFIRRFERGMEKLDIEKHRPEIISFSIIAGLFEFMGTSWLVTGK